MPRPLVKAATFLLQRWPHRPWMSVGLQRRIQDLAARATRIPVGVTVTGEELGGVRTDLIAAGDPDQARAVLYSPGGAYVGGSLEPHRGIAAQIALGAGVQVPLVDYRLAPEHPSPAG